MSHTPEPWIFTVAGDFYCGLIMGSHGGEVFDGDFTEANARRIVACVNACEGVPTEVLEEGGQGTVAASMARLTEQRDELLAALQGLADDIHSLIHESSGVAGLHLNDDLAPWRELEAGGRFERLTHLPIALEAIAAAKAGA